MNRTYSSPRARARAARRRREALKKVLFVGIASMVIVLACIWGSRSYSASLSSPEPVEPVSLNTSLPLKGPGQQTEYTTLDEDWITVNLLPVNEYSRPGDPLGQVKDLVVHYVANPSTTAAQNRNYFATLAESHETSASSHFIVGLEGEVLQIIPLNEISYGSNDRNGDTIAIECCHPDESGKFNEDTYRSLVRLLRTLCEMYDLDETHIIRHYDVTGKLCPLYYVDHPDDWEQLKADVFDPSFSVE